MGNHVEADECIKQMMSPVPRQFLQIAWAFFLSAPSKLLVYLRQIFDEVSIGDRLVFAFFQRNPHKLVPSDRVESSFDACSIEWSALAIWPFLINADRPMRGGVKSSENPR